MSDFFDNDCRLTKQQKLGCGLFWFAGAVVVTAGAFCIYAIFHYFTE